MNAAARPRFAALPLAEIHVTDRFGVPRPTAADPHKIHPGIDLRAAIGTPVFAVDDGRVTSIELGTSAGNIVRYVTRHGRVSCMHLQGVDCSIGDDVVAGQQIARSGNTGQGNTGPHLHLELKPTGLAHSVDPGPYFL